MTTAEAIFAAARQQAPEPASAITRTLAHIAASDLPDEDAEFDDEIVEGVIGRASMAVMYGDSNSGKTFLMIDMAAAVALADEWLGRRTVGGLVLYLATEAVASVEMRVRAWQRHYGRRIPGLVIVQSPINLFDGAADTEAVIALVAEVERRAQRKVILIVGDTMARIAAGANENSGQDMGVVIANAERIRAATLATFLWIHHCGKNAAMGMRGWSGMRAAIDTEIEVSADDVTGLRSAEITKQRDLPGKGDRLGFRLLPVHMGVNRWGTERGSCVVECADAPAKVARGKRPSEIAGAITEFLTTHGTGCLRGAMAKHFEDRFARQSVYREINKMLDAGLLIEAVGVVALPGAPKVPR